MADGRLQENPTFASTPVAVGRVSPPNADELAAFAEANNRLQMWAWRQDFNTGIDGDILLAPENLQVGDWLAIVLQFDVFDTNASLGDYQIRLMTAVTDAGERAWQEIYGWTDLPIDPGDSLVLPMNESLTQGLLQILQWQIKHNGVSTGTLAFQIKVFFKARAALELGPFAGLSPIAAAIANAASPAEFRDRAIALANAARSDTSAAASGVRQEHIEDLLNELAVVGTDQLVVAGLALKAWLKSRLKT